MAKYKGPKLTDLKGDALRQRVQQLASNPGTQAKVPTKYLTGNLAKYAQQRLLEERLNAPIVPGSGETNRDLAHEAAAAVQLQYGGQEQALGQRLASNANQPAQTAGYYGAWINQLRQAAAAQPAQTAGLVSQLQGIGAQGQAAGDAANAQILAQMQTDAANRGATVDPSVAQRFQQGTAVNRGVQDAQAGTAALLGANQQGYLGALAGGATAGLAQQLNRIGSDRAGLLAEQQQLKASEGASNLDYRSKARSAESQNLLNQALAGSQVQSRATTAAVQQQNANTSASRAKTAAKTAKTDQQTKEQVFAAAHEGYTPAEFAKLSPGQQLKVLKDVKAAQTSPHAPKTTKGPKPTSGPGSLTTVEEQKRVSQVERAAGLIRDKKIATKDANGNPTLKPVKDRGAVIAWLKAQGIDPNVLAVADSLVANTMKGIGPRGVKAAHAAGIHIGGRWKVINAPTGGASTYGGRT